MKTAMEEKNPIQVADRLFRTMETLAATGPISLMELSERLELHKSTVHRLLTSLICMGYARQDEDTGKYSLTYKLLSLSSQILDRVDILDVVRPYLRRLSARSNETVHMVQLDGLEAVYIDKVESQQNSVRMVSRIGNRIPLYRSGVGKALMAAMSDKEIARIWEESEICALTEHTITDFDQFMETIGTIRRQGFAMDNEENELGVRCVAAALPDAGGKIKYAFSISAPVARMDEARVQELSQWLLETRQEILHALGRD